MLTPTPLLPLLLLCRLAALRFMTHPVLETLCQVRSDIPEPQLVMGDFMYRHVRQGRCFALGSFAEFEREMIRERTKLGLARARLEGRIGGNRAKLDATQAKHALGLVDEGMSQRKVARIFRVHPSTISRLISERRVLQKP
jgi:hypothetical protein